jgi:hypothetical protein
VVSGYEEVVVVNAEVEADVGFTTEDTEDTEDAGRQRKERQIPRCAREEEPV